MGTYATTAQLKAVETRLDAKIDAAEKRLISEIVRVQSDVRELKHKINTELPTKAYLEPMMRLIDRCLKQFIDQGQRQDLQGALLAQQGDRLNGLERRLSRLEGRSRAS